MNLSRMKTPMFFCNSTTTVIDKLMGKVDGEPYRGKPDVRFDEGTKGRNV